MILQFCTPMRKASGTRCFLQINTVAEAYCVGNPYRLSGRDCIEIKVKDYKELIQNLKDKNFTEVDMI